MQSSPKTGVLSKNILCMSLAFKDEKTERGLVIHSSLWSNSLGAASSTPMPLTLFEAPSSLLLDRSSAYLHCDSVYREVLSVALLQGS